MDWLSHLAISPGKQQELAQLAASQMLEMARLAADPNPQQTPASQDRRFAAPAWQQWPFNLMQHGFGLQQRWWEAATQGVSGVAPLHQSQVAFGIRQWLDMLSPSNLLATNPEVLEKTRAENGENLLRGMQHWLDDALRQMAGQPPAGAEDFVLGRDLAATPGKVVLRNRLIELIQYSPSTAEVHPEPLLLIPAWIMKYYVLDLSQHNSLIRYLVEQGHTVFCISWKNPGESERDLGMDDYLELGLQAALDAICAIVPGQKIHGAGYCLGGTLLSIGAAAMARDGDERLASLTLLAAQTDFSEPGEISLFIDDSQVAQLEAQMADSGYLRGDQMAAAFALLRARDLVWSRMVNEYLLGERQPMNDLMAWNADATRMPARMHSQYLRRLYLNNDLAAGRYPVKDQPVSLTDVRTPVFCVGTTTDHVAPWPSVYKLHHLCPAQITFVLTRGGHNAGIVSEPGRPRRSYHIATRAAGGRHCPVQSWSESATEHAGSWWPAWHEWLCARSAPLQAPPAMGAPASGYAPVGEAPGTYVLEK